MMSGIRGKDTKLEMLIRKALHKRGFRYLLHDDRLPGKPDLVFPKYKAIIMVNSCFFHGHDCHMFKWPATRPDFWKKKISGNQARDAKVLDQLSSMGWRVCTIWECAVRGKERLPLDDVISTVAAWLTKGTKSREIRGKSKG